MVFSSMKSRMRWRPWDLLESQSWGFSEGIKEVRFKESAAVCWMAVASDFEAWALMARMCW